MQMGARSATLRWPGPTRSRGSRTAGGWARAETGFSSVFESATPTAARDDCTRSRSGVRGVEPPVSCTWPDVRRRGAPFSCLSACAGLPDTPNGPQRASSSRPRWARAHGSTAAARSTSALPVRSASAPLNRSTASRRSMRARSSLPIRFPARPLLVPSAQVRTALDTSSMRSTAHLGAAGASRSLPCSPRPTSRLPWSSPSASAD